MPVLTVAISCMSIAASLIPFAVSGLPDRDYLNWIPIFAILIAGASSCSTLPMLLSAYCTLVVFTDLHRGVKWSEKSLRRPTALHRWLARPAYLAELPLEEDEEASNGNNNEGIVMEDDSAAAHAYHAS